MLPNFLVIGAEKSGTTWIYDRLRRHPDIFMPEVKEVHFFNRLNSNFETRQNYKEHDLEWYRAHFRNREREAAVGEATPMYLCDEKAPERIHLHAPDVGLIACLRYPTDRAYSHYWMARGKKHTTRSFQEVVQSRSPRFINRGRYGKQLDRYLSHFDRSQIHILVHEELFADPIEHLNEICSFLGVDDTFYRDQSWITDTVNRSSTVRSTILHKMIGRTAKWMRDHEGFRQMIDLLKKSGITDRVKEANKAPRDYPDMPYKLRHELDQYYAPTVQRVEEVLNREIQPWRNRSTASTLEPSSSG
ncbi:sulfotransferase domain-containing protein [Salinibacter ruber]|uniref:sulfotransferase domain-containing protein n=1 Tax=Salinibacter ruber TaxID=146919 RepID=UPI002073F4B6|nr:sulfotransferase domain-containing protein [Salinibacter ruber]